VAEFLALLHRTTYEGYASTSSKHSHHPFFASAAPPGAGGDAGDNVQLITVAPDASLVDAIGVMLRHRVHRVYVAADADAPVPAAVVTPTDVMRVVAGVQ